MKNKITDLNNYLFEQIEKLNDEDLTEDELDLQIKKADKICDISRVLIKTQSLQLDAAKTLLDYGKIEPNTFKNILIGMNNNGQEVQ